MILVYIDALERFNFFKRLDKPRKEFLFVTHLLSVKLLSVLLGYRCELVRSKKINKKIIRQEVLEDNIEQFSTSEIDCIYYSIYTSIEDILSQNHIKEGYVWNGMRVVQSAFSDAVKQQKVKVKFFEITNLPGKMQIDNEGVNAQSSLMGKKGSIQDYTDLTKWQDWKKEFRENCFTKKVGQVSILKKTNYWFVIDFIGVSLFNCLKLEKKSILKKIVQKKNFKSFSFQGDLELPKNFAFLPLQVSSDSQVLINYHSDILGSIKEAKDYSQSKGLDLVIKPHPAEINIEKVNELLDLKEKLGFYISDRNTYELIEDSNQVITINSTVGLESLLLGKKVRFLGLSLYSDLRELQVAEVILNKYYNIDYFESETWCID